MKVVSAIFKGILILGGIAYAAFASALYASSCDLLSQKKGISLMEANKLAVNNLKNLS